MSNQRKQQSLSRRRPSSPFPNISFLAAECGRGNQRHHLSHPYTFRESTRRRRTMMVDNVRSDLTNQEIFDLVAPCSVLCMQGRIFFSRPHMQTLQITFAETYDVQQTMNIRPFGPTNDADAFPTIYNRINEFSLMFDNTGNDFESDDKRIWTWRKSSILSNNHKNTDLAERLYRQTCVSEEKVHYKKLKQRLVTNRYNVPTLISPDISSDDSQQHSRTVSPVDSLFQYYLDESEPLPAATMY